MKRQFRNITILLFPFIAVIALNELVRPTMEEEGYRLENLVAINSDSKNVNKCSWACHNATIYCKENHLAIIDKENGWTDMLYFGLMSALKATGNYGLANILILVILMPLVLYFLTIKCIDIQIEIRKLKSKL